jgi:ribosomal protein S18 acetylase RimI-like enzyme
MIKVRQANQSEIFQLLKLYQAAAQTKNGIARKPEEISKKLIADFVKNSSKSGLIFVIENPDNRAELIAEIHCYKHEPLCFKHVFGNLILVIHPNFQGQGLGRKIFSHLLLEVAKNHHNIARIELFCRQNNLRGLKLYQSLGFVVEGILKNRVLNSENEIDADIIMAWFNPNFLSD